MSATKIKINVLKLGHKDKKKEKVILSPEKVNQRNRKIYLQKSKET